MSEFRQITLIASALLALGVAAPAWAQNPDEGKHCPDHPAATSRFFESADSTDQDRLKLDSLAGPAKAAKAVCILAFVDGNDTGGYTRKLAIRRVKWLLDGLTAHGIPREFISYEFRAAPADTDKAGMRHVDVVLGR